MGSPAVRDREQKTRVAFGLAYGWLRRGRLDQAIQHFEKVLAVDPAHEPSFLALAQILEGQRRWRDLAALCERGLGQLPGQAELHKRLITSLLEMGSWADAYGRYDLRRRDTRLIDIQPGAILCCLVVRNEAARLPYFFEYYRGLGVDHFLVVDNLSSDATLSLLLDQPDVHVWQSGLSFDAANFGSVWFELLLRRYGIGHWCLTLDADELVVFADSESRSLRTFCRQLEHDGFAAAAGILLDMYSDRPVADTVYEAGTPFIQVSPYFDRRWSHYAFDNAGPFRNMTFQFGGARHRVFGDAVEYLVTKVPLLRYRPETILAGGQHWTNYPAEQIAADHVVVLHFKYFASFTSYARQEARRGVHSGGGEQYKAYAQRLNGEATLALYDHEVSVRYDCSRQLVTLGMLADAIAPPAPHFPPVGPPLAGEGDPFWTVVITVYNRLDFVARALDSVLAQITDDMELLVVNDGADQSVQRALEAIVRDAAGERARLILRPENVGHPHIFNVCLSEARGQWVHILHDDDWVRPGFYAALRAGVMQAPSAGAAFCRHDLHDGDGRVTWTSWLEREEAGLIDDWLARIAVECRLQFSSMVVRRDVYELLGGYCTAAASAFDWEMWKRIAVHFDVWFEPRTLACVARDGTAETDFLELDGRQLADAMATVEISRAYLPPDVADLLSAKAYERIALYGLDLARRQLQAGETEAALANVRTALRGWPSARVARSLAKILEQAP